MRNVLFALLTQGAPLVVAVFAIPVLVTHLGIARFGVLSLGWVVLGYASAFDLGVARAATKRIAQSLGGDQPHLLERIGPTALGVNLVLGLAGGMVFALAAPVFATGVLRTPSDLVEDTYLALLVIAAGIPVILLQSATRGVLEGAQRFDLVAIVAIPSSVLSYLLPAVGAGQSAPLWSLVLTIVVVRLLAVVAYMLLWRRAAPTVRVFARPQRDLAIALLQYGGWLTISNATSPVVLYGERAVVGAALGVTGLGFYVIPYEVAARYAVIPGAMYAALFPTFSTMAGSITAQATALYRRSVSFLLLVLVPPTTILIALSNDLLRLWLGTDVATKTAVPLELFATGALANSLAYVPLALLQGSGRADLPAKLQVLEILPTLFLTWVLSSTLVLPGAALAWLCRVVADTGLLFVLAGHVAPAMGLPRLGHLQRSVLIAIIGLSVAVMLTGLEPFGLKAALTAVTVSAILGAMWRTSLTLTERAWIVHMMRRIVPTRLSDSP